MKSELRAGYADALRTPNARPLAGRTWGDIFYAAGYFIGALR